MSNKTPAVNFRTCPHCGGLLEVKDTRTRKTSIYRMRYCVDCGEQAATYEITREEYRRLVTEAGRLAELRTILGGLKDG